MSTTRGITFEREVLITVFNIYHSWCVRLVVCSAIIEHTNQVIYLEDNDVASISQGVLTIDHMCFSPADQAQSTLHEITTLTMQIQQIMKGYFTTALQV